MAMDDNNKQEHLQSLDQVLDDVREHLPYVNEQGDAYELRALQLLLEVTKAMHREHDIYRLVTMILDSALSFAEAERAFLMLLDEEGDLRFKMGRTYAGEYLSEEDFVISTSVVNEALDGQKPVILADAQRNEHFKMRDSILDLELRTIMAAPLRTSQELLGLLYVDSRRPLIRYSKHHRNVLASLADQAAIAIFNARKFETHNG
ncbi:MAG: GAF domain-containing protein [Chloroflexi bacterium]|nr:GAF domain-containing protein [Chloroflexota bacterium]